MEWWHSLAETVKNFAEILAIIGGAFAIGKWLFERYDRATDVLLELEKKFNEPQLLLGRGMIEDDIAYGEIVPLLHTAVLEAVEPIPLTESKLSARENDLLAPVDSLLRFYILLHGIRRARQVPDLPLKTCFRYWLTQYYGPYRTAFRAYVDTFFPTLTNWLKEDQKHGERVRRFRPSSYLLRLISKLKRSFLDRGNPLGAKFQQTSFRDYVRSFFPVIKKSVPENGDEPDNEAKRISFRDYIGSSLISTQNRLRHDQNEAIEARRFFTPVRFGWGWNEEDESNQFRRAINGRVLVITGSGISADSGIPTFRGLEGYWRKRNPQELATRKAFDDDPDSVWKWYRQRRKMIKQSDPNKAHHAIVELATRCKELLLVTQNVDDLHERARFNEWKLSKDQVVHIHGQIFVTRCRSCDYKREDRNSSDKVVPKCPKCRGPMRPGVVWFDEELELHEQARINKFLRRGPCDLVLVIGTTATFDYIRAWALKAGGHNGWVLEINPSETHLSIFANQVIRKKAAATLPALVKASIERGPIGLGA